MGERGTPRLTADQVIAVLRRNGFALAGQTGSHKKYRNADTGRQVIVAYHSGKVLPPGTMKSIVEGSGIARSDWSN